MDDEKLDRYRLPLDQRLDTIALLLDRVDELAAWIEPDEKTAVVLDIIMMHIQSARTLATSSEFLKPGSEPCQIKGVWQHC